MPAPPASANQGPSGVGRDPTEVVMARESGPDFRRRCARQELNLRPRAPEARALSPELRALARSSVSAMDLSARIVTLRLAETFTISRGSEDEADVVQIEISHDGHSGFGEAAPIDRYDE